MPDSKAASAKSVAKFIHLDMARGLAALLVLLGHLRSFVFVSYADLEHHTPLDTFVWMLTGFGHQSVMVFFVLSGFFITRSIVADGRSLGFSWPVYMIKRLSRLWIVLLPCLLLTLAWDNLGIILSGTKFYTGELYSIYNSGPSVEDGGAHLDSSTFFGNLLFLQTIIVPIFGSNGPLWSLSNEFWYYVLFPLIFIGAAQKNKPLIAIVSFLAFVAVCFFIGQYILLSGLIWLGGAIVYIAYERELFASVLRTRSALVIASLILLGALAFSKGRIGSDLVKDYAVGLGSAALVLVLAQFEGSTRAYRLLATTLADGSYTMYLVHFSFAAFLVNCILHNQKFGATVSGYLVFIGLVTVTLAYCYAIYWLFERHTGKLRRYCLSMLKNGRRSAIGN